MDEKYLMVVKLGSDDISPIAISLITENIIFDFATKFAFENQSISSISEFEISDNIFNDFTEYALLQDFKYETFSERELQELENVLKKEKYYERVESEVNMLKSKLVNDKRQDITGFKEDIKDFLRDEIVGRYYYEDGQIQASLKNDNQLYKAIDILRNKNLYVSILTGEYKEKKADAKLSLFDPGLVNRKPDAANINDYIDSFISN